MNLDGGSVSIGTGAPSCKLSLYDTTSVRLDIQNDSIGDTISSLSLRNKGANVGILFLNSTTRTFDGGPNAMTLRNDAGILRLQDSSLSGITISGGLVGILNTNPSYNLDVSGSLRVTQPGSAQYIINLGATGVGGYRSAYIYGDGTNMFINNQQFGYLEFDTGNQLCMKIYTGTTYVYNQLFNQITANDTYTTVLRNNGSTLAYGLLIDYNNTPFALGIRDRNNVYIHRFGGDGTAQFGGTGGSTINILAKNIPTLTSAGDFYIGMDKDYTSTNTAVGKQALNSILSNTAQIRNTAVGYLAGGYTSTGGYNAFYGSYAGGLNTIGQGNVFVGDAAAYANTRGNFNVAVGYASLRFNINSSDNTAVGNIALYNYSGATGQNTVVGSEAGTTMVTNGNCLVLGYNAEPSSTTVSNEITLGDSRITTLRCNTTSITSLSDQRDKRDIVDMPSMLNVVNSLRPVRFEWNTRDGKKVGIKDYGFIAQEVDQVQQSTDTEWLDLVYKSNLERLEMTPGKLIPVLTKSVQELSQKLEASENKVNSLVNIIKLLTTDQTILDQLNAL